jgi:ATP-dependent Clp protease adapter protein ClpS
MIKYSVEKYDQMISEIRNQLATNSLSEVDSDVDTDSITRLLNELGIGGASDKEVKLVLWNDHVNDMMSVIVALYEVCKLSNEDCVRVMLEAHEKGKAVVKTGSFDELNTMKHGLNDRNLEATIEE